jgi:quercetin dioxygenase-like cupin family protein
MDTNTAFVPNVDMMIPFNSKVMLLDNIAGSENGQTFIKAGADGPPIHTHPIQEEWMQCISGELEVYCNKKWSKLKPGDRIHISKNEAHTYRNRGGEDCIFAYLITPKGSFSDMMKCFERIAKEGKLTSLKKFNSLLYLAIAFKKFKKDVRSIAPPDFAMSAMAFIGRMKGFKV